MMYWCYETSANVTLFAKPLMLLLLLLLLLPPIAAAAAVDQGLPRWHPEPRDLLHHAADVSSRERDG
jgi:hypothetical protein